MGGPRCDGCGRFARIAAEVPVMDVFKQYVEDWRWYCAICAPTQPESAVRDHTTENKQAIEAYEKATKGAG